MANTHTGKEVIYVDIDDEITALIDHVKSSQEKIVALVLPKRAGVLQSIVNMKLLKRTADDSKKHLVLITTEAGLLPLAGAVGIYVAKSLQSRPSIPHNPMQMVDDEDQTIDADAEDIEIDSNRPVGELAATDDAEDITDAVDAPEANDDIVLDETQPEASDNKADNSKKKSQSKKDKKLTVPDFNKFKRRLALVLTGIIALGALTFAALVVMPKASVYIKTDSTTTTINSDITLDTSVDMIDVDKKLLPAERQIIDKTSTQQANATGQRNQGEKAAGSVTLSLTNCSEDRVTVPAGTGISTNGLTYITKEKAYMVATVKGGICKNDADSSDTVEVIAQGGGEKYNIDSGAKFSVPSYSNVRGVGTKITGGTDVLIQVLTQADIDGAKQQLASQDTANIKSELKSKLEKMNVLAMDETFFASDPQINVSAKAGDEVATVTVTQKATYSMFGASEDDLKRIIDNLTVDKIDKERQRILDYGLSKASFKPQSQDDKKVSISLGTTVMAGTALDLADIKKQIAGKKSNAAQQLIDAYPGVVEVKVTYSPFWVQAVPKDTKKIQFNVENPPVSNSDGQ